MPSITINGVKQNWHSNFFSYNDAVAMSNKDASRVTVKHGGVDPNNAATIVMLVNTVIAIKDQGLMVNIS